MVGQVDETLTVWLHVMDAFLSSAGVAAAQRRTTPFHRQGLLRGVQINSSCFTWCASAPATAASAFWPLLEAPVEEAMVYSSWERPASGGGVQTYKSDQVFGCCWRGRWRRQWVWTAWERPARDVHAKSQA